jgi:hypothetical protein
VPANVHERTGPAKARAAVDGNRAVFHRLTRAKPRAGQFVGLSVCSGRSPALVLG